MTQYLIYAVAGLFGFLVVYLPGHFRRRRQRREHLARFDAMIERYAREAERGYDVSQLRDIDDERLERLRGRRDV